MKIRDLGSQADKTQLESIELQLLAIESEKTGQYGTNLNTKVQDETGSTYATFASMKNHDIKSLVGKKVRLDASKNQAGALCSIRVDKKGNFSNLWITNSVKITVIGEASAPAPVSVSAPTQSNKPVMIVPPEVAAMHCASEWVAVYKWTTPIFSEVLEKEQWPERVTGVLMDMRKRGYHEIVPPPKLDWRQVTYKDTKLGEWETERMLRALVKIYKGANVAPEIREAFLEAGKEELFNPVACFYKMLSDEAIDQETMDTVLLRRSMSTEDMKAEHYLNFIVDATFLEECKQAQANRPTPFDEIEV